MLSPDIGGWFWDVGLPAAGPDGHVGDVLGAPHHVQRPPGHLAHRPPAPPQPQTNRRRPGSTRQHGFQALGGL